MIVYKGFGNYISKDRGLCGRGLCVPFVWLDVGYVQFVCIDGGGFLMAAQRGP